MPVPLDIKVDNRQVQIGIGELVPLKTRAMLVRLGTLELALNKVGVTVKRTTIDGEPIKPSLRAIEENGTTLVDKGHMLGSERIQKATNELVSLGFGGAKEREKAYKHQFGVGVPLRPFFGFRPGDIEKLTKDANSWADEEIQKAGLS